MARRTGHRRRCRIAAFPSHCGTTVRRMLVPGKRATWESSARAGEIVLFIGDDIMADERLLEEHLLAHAGTSEPGAAILGHIDWPQGMTPNGVMDYVCGDAMLQFAYSYIPTAPALDHRFFYTSNISLKRQFLVDAADAGIRFDPRFRRAAFEDSEFAFRLMPRGLAHSLRRQSARARTITGWISTASPGASSVPAKWRSSSIESIPDRTSNSRCGGLRTSSNRRRRSWISRSSAASRSVRPPDRRAAARAGRRHSRS